MADLYQPRNEEELVQRFLRDVRLAALDAGLDEPPTQVGTDFWLTAKGVAGMALLGFQNIQLAESDQSILTATGDALDRLRVAEGLPEVSASAATGRLVVTVTGPTTIPAGQTFLYGNGVRGEVTATYVNPADQSEVSVRALEPGSKTNLAGGAPVRFISPPVNVSVEAFVSVAFPLSGGTDVETDGRKRDRILNSKRNKPAGGNWAQLRQIALDASGSVQECYVFPALGGPSSCKVVPVKDMDPTSNDFSRSMPSAALDLIRSEIHARVSSGEEIVVQASEDVPADFTIKIKIPDSSAAGGNGLGWTDAIPWPQLEGGDSNDVQVSAPVTDPSVIVIDAVTATEPIEGQTHIAWWSSADRRFRTALVIDATGGTGAWTLTLDRPLVDSTGSPPAVGDYICPAAQNLDGYGVEWIQIFRELGVGENTADADLLPRAKRHPFVTDEDPSDITNAVLLRLVRKFPEITNFALGVASPSTPPIPSAVADAPGILVPRKFAVYPL